MASGIKHLLECNVCSNSYNDKERVPKGLPCQHTFCLACLKRIKTHGFHTGEDGSVSIKVLVKCPECGQRFLAPGENINNFPNNLTMISLLGAMKKTVALRPTPESDLRSCLADRVQRLRDEISESAEMLVGNLSNLEKQVKSAKTSIKNTFSQLRDAIDRREEYLLDEVDDFMARKESIVKHPTDGMAKQLQEMEKFCNEMDKRAKVRRDSRLPTYIDHCLELIENLEYEKRHPKWEASFQPGSVDAIRASISQFGELELFAPESDESDGDEDDHRYSSGSSFASRRRHRNSSPYSISPTPSENAIEYNNEEHDRQSAWSPMLSTSGSYTDDTADEAVTSNHKYRRQEKPEVRKRDRNAKSPPNRRRRITAIQSSFEFEKKYGGVPQLAEPPSSRLLAIGPPTSSVYSRSGEHSRPNSHSTSTSSEYHTIRSSELPPRASEVTTRSSQQNVRASEMSRASGTATSRQSERKFSHDSFDYEVPDFDSMPHLPSTLRRNTAEKLRRPATDKSHVTNTKNQIDDKDEIYSQPFDSEDHLTDDVEAEDNEYVGAGLAWPPIPKNNNSENLPDGFELLQKPYLGRQDTMTSMDSYVDMDLHIPNPVLSYSKSDCETDTDPLEVLENLDNTQEETQVSATDSSSTQSQNTVNIQADDIEKTPRNSEQEQGSKKNRKRSVSGNSNDIKEQERTAPSDPAARRKAFVDSHHSDYVDVESSKSLYEDIAEFKTSSPTMHAPPLATPDYSDAPLMMRAVSNGSEMATSESETEQPNSRVVSRTVSIELPDISSLSFNVGKVNGVGEIPTEIPPIMDTPGVGVGTPIFANLPIFVLSNLQDSSSKMRPSSWSPRMALQGSTTHHLTVNGAVYTEVRRSSWSPLSNKEFEEFEHGLSVSEWSSDESSSEEEDPYEIMSWSLPCGLNNIDKLESNNQLPNQLRERDVDRNKLSPTFKRKSHPARFAEAYTSTDEMQAQPRPRSYALCRQDRFNSDKSESQIYWFPPRRLSRKRNSRKLVYKLAEVSGDSSMETPSTPTRSSVPPRVAKKPLMANKSK